jgi:hypothetical protein
MSMCCLLFQASAVNRAAPFLPTPGPVQQQLLFSRPTFFPSSGCAGHRRLLCPLPSPPYQAAAARVTGGCCVPSPLPLIKQRLRGSPAAAVSPPLSPLSSSGCAGHRRLLCPLPSLPYQAAAARVTGGCCVPSPLPLIKQRLRGSPAAVCMGNGSLWHISQYCCMDHTNRVGHSGTLVNTAAWTTQTGWVTLAH